MELVSSWERKGIEQGMHEGKEGLVIRQLKRRFGSITPQVTQRLGKLHVEQLDELGEALLDFASAADLETWLARH